MLKDKRFEPSIAPVRSQVRHRELKAGPVVAAAVAAAAAAPLEVVAGVLSNARQPKA